MAKAILWGTDGYDRIVASCDLPNDPLTFEDIYQHFKDNPMSADYDMPVRNGVADLAENNAAEWFGLMSGHNGCLGNINYKLILVRTWP